MKEIFKNKYIKWGAIAAALVFVAWAFWEVSRRIKARENYIAKHSDKDPANEYHKQVQQRADDQNITYGQRLEIEANALFPLNPFVSPGNDLKRWV